MCIPSVVAANAVKDAVEAAVKNKRHGHVALHPLAPYDVLSGSKQVVAGTNYRISLWIQPHAVLDIMVFRSLPPFKYELKSSSVHEYKGESEWIELGHKTREFTMEDTFGFYHNALRMKAKELEKKSGNPVVLDIVEITAMAGDQSKAFDHAAVSNMEKFAAHFGQTVYPQKASTEGKVQQNAR